LLCDLQQWGRTNTWHRKMHSLIDKDNSSLPHVFILDSDPAELEALTKLLEVAGHEVTTFSGAFDFLDACTQNTQGCLIATVKIHDMNGLELQEELTRRGILLPIIFLTKHGTIPLSVRAIKAGAMDFFTKPVDETELLACVKQSLIKSSELNKQANKFRSKGIRLLSLTLREKEVMVLVVNGLSSKKIATQLGINFRTVENYRANVMHKTACSNILELARFAESIASVSKVSIAAY